MGGSVGLQGLAPMTTLNEGTMYSEYTTSLTHLYRVALTFFLNPGLEAYAWFVDRRLTRVYLAIQVI